MRQKEPDPLESLAIPIRPTRSTGTQTVRPSELRKLHRCSSRPSNATSPQSYPIPSKPKGNPVWRGYRHFLGVDENGTINKKRRAKHKSAPAAENGSAADVKGVAAAAGMVATEHKVNAALGLGGAVTEMGASLGHGVSALTAAVDLQGLVATAEAYESESAAAASLKRKREDDGLHHGQQAAKKQHMEAIVQI